MNELIVMNNEIGRSGCAVLPLHLSLRIAETHEKETGYSVSWRNSSWVQRAHKSEIGRVFFAFSSASPLLLN
jgi:hypothetical protein